MVHINWGSYKCHGFNLKPKGPVKKLNFFSFFWRESFLSCIHTPQKGHHPLNLMAIEAIEAVSSFHYLFFSLVPSFAQPPAVSSSSAELSGAPLNQGDVSSPVVLLQLIHWRFSLGSIPTLCLCLLMSTALGMVGSKPKLGMILVQKQHWDQRATVVSFSTALSFSNAKYCSFRANSAPAEVSRSLPWISMIFI